ncbi:MAG: Ig-like domain-containing protein, partial [Verrucomicrobiota bacterium]
PSWGNYTPSNGAALASDFNYAYSGQYSVRIHPRHNYEIEHTNPIDVAGPGYDVIKIDFRLHPAPNTSVGAGFDVEFFDGTTWHVVGAYRNIHGSQTVTEWTYKGNAPEHKTIFVEAKDYIFPNNMKIAIRSDDHGVSAGTHNLYIDNFLVQAATSGGSKDFRPIAYSQALVAGPGSNTVVLSAFDPDGDPITYGYTMPSNGVISGIPPNLIYIPNMGYSGVDTFTFWGSDSVGTGTIASIGLLVDQDVSSNAVPVAHDQAVNVGEGLSIGVVLTGFDGDGDTLNFSLVTNPLKGTLNGMPPNLTYSSSGGQTGADSFTFTVDDGKVAGTTGTVSVTISPDILPPLPNPARWYIEPYQSGPGEISMAAQTGFEVSGVEYYFACTAGNCNDSGWQDSPN